MLQLLRIGLLLWVVGRIQSLDIHVIAEKGQQKTLECSFSSPVISITWKLFDVGNKEVSLSTCTTTACTDQQPQNYTGNIAGSAGTYRSTLNIHNVGINQSQFTCLADTGSVIVSIILDVYVVPSTPTCEQKLVLNQYNPYVDVICEIENMYPNFRYQLHRKESSRLLIDKNATVCTYGSIGSGSKGDRVGQCTIRVPASSLLEYNTFYLVLYPLVWNDTIVNRPAISKDLITSISLPRIAIYKRDCPVGPGVIGENIKIGTNATCKCELTSSGLFTANVRWFKNNETVIGKEDPSGRFSILTLDYNVSDPNPEYDCRAVNPFAEYYHIVYKPKFTSSAHRILFSGLTVVVVFSTVYMNLVFKLG